MRPENRLAGRVRSGRQPIEIIRPIHVVLDVFLAAPDHLHRGIDVLGDLDGQHRAIGLQPSSEAAANGGSLEPLRLTPEEEAAWI